MIAIVVAAAENNVIGKDNNLIWYLPADLKHFKRLTMGHPMVMGRKTYESIGKPLPGRTSVVVTSQQDYSAEGCVVVHSLQDALREAQQLDPEQVSVIGGANVYEQALPSANVVYLTRVHHAFEGDVYFPELPPQEWELTEEEHHDPDEKNKYSYTFQTYRRR